MCSFRVAVERHLKSRARLPVRLFSFRGDVFHFLFAGKRVSREGWTFLEKKMTSLLFILSLGGILGWIVMAKELGFFLPNEVKNFHLLVPKEV